MIMLTRPILRIANRRAIIHAAPLAMRRPRSRGTGELITSAARMC